MEAQGQTELLSKLYTLRAGISAVAVEKDKADRGRKVYQDRISSLQNAISENIQEIEDRQGECDSEQPKISSEISEKEKLLEEKERDHRWYLKYEIPREKRRNRACIFFLILAILLGLSSIIRFILVFTTLDKIYFLDWFLPLLGGFVAYILMAVFSHFLGGYVSKKERRSRIKSEKDEISKLKKEITDLKRVYSGLAVVLEQTVQDNTSENVAMQQEVKQLEGQLKTDPNICKCVQTGEVLYMGLQGEFRALLDERDWENLDFIIYMLETGRADSMKEALQLVDGEKRTDRIVNAIENASQFISATFVEGVRIMSDLIAQCCSSLSRSITLVGQAVCLQGEQMQGLQSYVGTLTNQVALGNALQAKANTTSLRIMQDVRTMREHSDYADYRLRYGQY